MQKGWDSGGYQRADAQHGSVLWSSADSGPWL